MEQRSLFGLSEHLEKLSVSGDTTNWPSGYMRN